MILGSKFRIHMGCGEPLQSRSWLRHSLQTRASAGNDVKSRGAPARQSASRQEVKCKS